MLVPVNGGMAPDINRIDRALLSFNQNNPEEAWWPQPVRRTLRYNGESIQLSPREFSRYERLAGEYAWAAVQVIPVDERNPTADQVEKIRSAFSVARRKAKEQIIGR